MANVQCTWGGDPEVEARGGGMEWRHGVEARGGGTGRHGVEAWGGGMGGGTGWRPGVEALGGGPWWRHGVEALGGGPGTLIQSPLGLAQCCAVFQSGG